MTEQNPRERLYEAIQQDVAPEFYESTVPNCLICQVALRRELPLGHKSYVEAVADEFDVPLLVVSRIFYGVIGGTGDGCDRLSRDAELRWMRLGNTYEGALQIAREILIDRVLEEAE